jgi:Domain of unknown function (DUF4198)
MTIEFHHHEVWSFISLAASLGVLVGHNFWMIAGQRRNQTLRVEAHVGHHFPNGESAIAPERIADFRLISTCGERPLGDCSIDGTALVTKAANICSGATMTVLSLHPRAITLAENSFTKYIQEEDALAFVAPDFVPGVTMAEQHEVYSKYAKAILATAHDELVCRPVGQKMEIVPERNPATMKPGEQLPLRVLLDGAPISGVRVSSGCDQLAQGGYATHARTDDDGRAEIALPIAGHWFVRSHLIRRHLNAGVAEGAQWESFWPSLTFRIDD